MPTFVPSSFSSTMSEESAMKSRDSCWPRCLSSSVPREPNKCGVRGYFMKSSRDAPMTTILRAGSLHPLGQPQPHEEIVQCGIATWRFRQVAGLERRLELGSQALVLAMVEAE